jgi:hypothetical protein
MKQPVDEVRKWPLNSREKIGFVLQNSAQPAYSFEKIHLTTQLLVCFRNGQAGGRRFCLVGFEGARLLHQRSPR